MRDSLIRLKFSVREWIGSHPSLIPRLAKGSKWEPGAVRPDSMVCIEAFPRSANTFSVAAFKLAGNDGHIARHSHLAGQVIRALDLGVPTMIIIREPLGAVASLKIRRPALGYAQMLRAYDRFYRLIQSRRDEFCTATFEEVTDDFGKVMARMNEERGTDFAVFEHDEAGMKAVFEEIEEMHAEYQQRTGAGDRDPNKIAIPQKGRSNKKEQVRSELESARYAQLLDTARARYESFLKR